MFFRLLLALVLVFDWAVADNYTDCRAIPKQTFPTVSAWAQQGPLTYDYTLDPMFNCSSQVFTYDVFGSTNSNKGSSIVAKGNVATIFEYVLAPDRQSVNAFVCGIENPVMNTWVALLSDSNAYGSFYCAAICNESAFAQFVCGSSNSTAFQSQEKALIDSVQGVPNGNKIVSARNGCTKPGNCSVWY